MHLQTFFSFEAWTGQYLRSLSFYILSDQSAGHRETDVGMSTAVTFTLWRQQWHVTEISPTALFFVQKKYKCIKVPFSREYFLIYRILIPFYVPKSVSERG